MPVLECFFVLFPIDWWNPEASPVSGSAVLVRSQRWCSVISIGGTEYPDVCGIFCDVNHHWQLLMGLPGPLIQQGLGNDDIPSSCISWNACTKKSFPSIFFFFFCYQGTYSVYKKGWIVYLLISLYLPFFKILCQFPNSGASLVAQMVCGRPGFNPWVGKIPWRRAWQPTSILAWRVPCSEETSRVQSMGSKESDMTFIFHIS